MNQAYYCLLQLITSCSEEVMNLLTKVPSIPDTPFLSNWSIEVCNPQCIWIWYTLTIITWYFLGAYAVPKSSLQLLGTRLTSVEEYKCFVSDSEISPSLTAYCSTPRTTHWRPCPGTAWKSVDSPCIPPPSSCAVFFVVVVFFGEKKM